MKDIIQELNDYNVPIIKIDDSLATVKYENRFSQKLADANAFLARAGVPKSFYTDSHDKHLLTQPPIHLQDKQIRRIFHNNEWWFSIIDMISVVTDSKNPSSYWSMMKKQEKDLSLISHKFKLYTQNNRQYFTDCANTEGMLRIVMSIPSPKVEPLQMWLAQLGQSRIEEIDNFELGFEHLTELYRAKGYPLEWIQERLITIEARKNLTEQWRSRGINEGQESSILTAQISKNTFGLTPSEHSKLKGLEKLNLRDNMTPLELHFTALGEKYTLKEILKKNALGFKENQDAAISGGILASNDLKKLEQKQGIKVISNQNYMHLLKGENMINLDRVLL